MELAVAVAEGNQKEIGDVRGGWLLGHGTYVGFHAMPSLSQEAPTASSVGGDVRDTCVVFRLAAQHSKRPAANANRP
jgi:hypothetical protein